MPATSSQFPPCARDEGRSDSIRTIVVKVNAPNATVMNWLGSATGAGRDAQAAAIVQLEKDTDAGIFYIVLSLHKRDTLQHIDRDLSKRLEAPPMSASINWIRPLDRRLQRLFDWGDAWVDQKLVEQIAQSDDPSDLKKYFPALATSVAIGDVQYFSMVANGLKTKGSLLLCLEDAPLRGDANEDRGLMRLHHEACFCHVFGEPSKRWECTICNEFGASQCVCGAQRCRHHQSIVVAPSHRVVWKQSDFAPAPFYVQNPKWMRKELKVEWIRDELYDDASLTEFAELYVKLFAEKGCVEKQRSSCLDLYKVFNPKFKPQKECELAPSELERFQRVFNPDAAARCRWCSKQLEDSSKLYCNATCLESANSPEKCEKCGGEDFDIIHAPRRLGLSRLDVDGGVSRCKQCKHARRCRVLFGYQRPKRRVEASHWSKRRRS